MDPSYSRNGRRGGENNDGAAVHARSGDERAEAGTSE